MNVVALIAKRFQTDVCSAYLLEPDRANLVLAATLGLRQECVGCSSSRTARGSCGPRCGRGSARRSRTRAGIIRVLSISARRARIRTSRFLAFLLIDRGVLQGVLVVQTIEARTFRQ